MSDFASDSLVRVVDALPQFASFFEFEYFNAVQSAMLAPIFHEDTNVVCTAPTASGKVFALQFQLGNLKVA